MSPHRGQSGRFAVRKGLLLIFCGIPGSGKTTVANLVTKALGVNSVHIQTDAIRMMIASPNYSWSEAQFVYRSVFVLGREALKKGYDVVLDGTFLKEDHRNDALRHLSRFFSSAFLVYADCDIEIARQRNRVRPAAVPEESFDRMSQSFEKPLRAIIIHTDRASPEACARHVIGALTRQLARSKLQTSSPGRSSAGATPNGNSSTQFPG